MATIHEQVTEFHKAFNVPIREKPGYISKPDAELRMRLIAEEFCEMLAAFGADISSVEDEIELAIDCSCLVPDLTSLADALADLDYVIEGTRLAFGIPGEAVAAEVHRSNMAKLGGTVRKDGKIMKPEGWQAPDIAGVLREHGWEG